MDVTTVADDLVVLHEGIQAHRFAELAAGTEYQFFDQHVRTLDRPRGELLCRFATVTYLLRSSRLSTARKASCGTSTPPTCFIRFLPFFCFSSSFRFRLMSPP